MTQVSTQNYLVAFGTLIFRVQEESPRQALEAVKAKILKDNNRPTLVETLNTGHANLLVMDETRTDFYAGEYKGQYQTEPSEELINSFVRLLPPRKYRERQPQSQGS